MKKLYQILAKVLEVNENEITEETSPLTVESWDSFSGLILVSELEREFQIKFTMQEITSVKCVKDIKNCLKNHGIQFAEEQ